MKSLLIGLLIIGFANVTVDSDKIIEEMENCAKIKNPSQRLDCYNALQKKYGAKYPHGLWRLETRIFPDEAKQIYLALKANDPIVVNGELFTPTLVLRCKEDKTEAYVLIGMRPFSDPKSHKSIVYLTFDNEGPRQYLFTSSTSGQSIFVPRPISFIRKLLKKNTMKVQFISAQAFPTTMTFSLYGLDKAIDELQTECHWK